MLVKQPHKPLTWAHDAIGPRLHRETKRSSSEISGKAGTLWMDKPSAFGNGIPMQHGQHMPKSWNSMES